MSETAKTNKQQEEDADGGGIDVKSAILFVIILGVAFTIAFIPIPGLPAEIAPGVGLIFATIALLATTLVAEYVTAILFFSIATLFAIAPTEVIFSGFKSSAYWLVFGGLVIGVGVKNTGLAARFARLVLNRIGNRYGAAVWGICLIATLLSFFMPSTTSRVLLLMPIVLALCRQMGFRPGDNGWIGLTMAVPFATMYPAFALLPANVPPLVWAGAAENLYGFKAQYGEYFLLHYPVLGLPKAIAIPLLVLWLFPDKARGIPELAVQPATALSRPEWLMGIILCGALGFWVTDFLHGISPAWIALAAAAICILPISNLVTSQQLATEINWPSLIYIAGILSLGAMVVHLDLGTLLSGPLLAIAPLSPGHDFINFISLSGLTSALAMIVTQPGIAAVMTPLSDTFAQAAGWPLEAALMVQVVGFSTALLPYQTPPIVVGMLLAGVPLWPVVKLSLALFVLTALVIVPLAFLWWRFLGWYF